MPCPSPSPSAPEPSNRPPSWRAKAIRWGWRSVAVAFAAGATYLGGCFLALLVYGWVFPPITGVQVQRSLEASVGSATHSRHYEPLPFTKIDPALPLAVVAAEDSRFFLHGGIDWVEVGNAIEAYRNGEELRGASSITQQLVKNLFLTTHSSYFRKGVEVPLTYAAELLLSKRRILELYLNVIEWGPGVYGVEAAAEYHYGSSARSLSRYRAAALAACIPAPRTRQPQRVGQYLYVILRRMNQIGQLPISELSPSGAPSERSVSGLSVADVRVASPRFLTTPPPTGIPERPR